MHLYSLVIVYLEMLYYSVQDKLTTEEDRAVLREHDVHLPETSQQRQDSAPSNVDR